MKKNMSVADRVIRVIFAVVIGILYFAHQITGTVAAILGVIAVIFLGTSSVGVCLVYKVLGISTLKDEGHHGGEAHGGAH
jgi:hypothetical protein